MIDKKLRDKILPNMLIHMDKDDYQYADYMLGECYLDTFEGMEVVAVRPIPKNDILTLYFHTLTGSCVGLANWDEVKERGKRL